VNLVNVAVATLTLAAHFLLALLVSPLLTLAAAVMLAVAAVLSMTLFKAARELAEYATSTQLALLDDTAQFLGAMKLAISQNLQHRFVADFARDMRRLVAQEVAFYEASGRVELRLAILAATVAAATIVVGVGILEVPVGELVLVVVLFARMNGPARKLQSSILEIVRALPAYRQLDDLDRHLAAATADAPEGGNVPGRGPIRFSGVTYRHADGEAVAGVRDLDLEIREGEFLGIAGRSGAGKTTFVDLLVGLYEPQAGGITVAGQPFQPARSSAWRDGIGYVAQDPFLRNDTVRANLLWVAPEATDAEIASVLALSGADLVVARLPQGLETVVGERGGLVSGGERQRIAIARALLRRPRLLILDEATNAIDIAGEHGLLSALRSLLPTTTIVTIAHRAESLALCDRIVVLRGGRVVDEGDYGQLRGRLVSLEQEDSG
jgi:ATP-binding cassette subfamily C protein